MHTGIEKLCSSHTELYPGTNVVALIRKYALLGEIQFPTAGEAWQMVLNAISSHGSGPMPKFKDEIVGEAVKCVGWRDINFSENIETVRAHFFKVYDQLVAKKKEHVMMGGM